MAAEYGRIDVAVNNAGLGGDTPLVEMTDEQWSAVLDVTLERDVPVHQGRPAAHAPARRRGHRQQRVGDRLARAGRPGALRRGEGRRHGADPVRGDRGGTRAGVRVNAVSPSIAMHPHLAKVSSEEFLAELSAREAFGRAAEPWEVADVIVFLASDYSSYMTGEVVSVCSQHP